MRRKPPTIQPMRCSCTHATDTPEWHGARSSGSGLTGRGAANHTDPRCVHSELARTVKPTRRPKAVQRIRL